MLLREFFKRFCMLFNSSDDKPILKEIELTSFRSESTCSSTVVLDTEKSKIVCDNTNLPINISYIVNKESVENQVTNTSETSIAHEASSEIVSIAAEAPRDASLVNIEIDRSSVSKQNLKEVIESVLRFGPVSPETASSRDSTSSEFSTSSDYVSLEEKEELISTYEYKLVEFRMEMVNRREYIERAGKPIIRALQNERDALRELLKTTLLNFQAEKADFSDRIKQLEAENFQLKNENLQEKEVADQMKKRFNHLEEYGKATITNLKNDRNSLLEELDMLRIDMDRLKHQVIFDTKVIKGLEEDLRFKVSTEQKKYEAEILRIKEMNQKHLLRQESLYKMQIESVTEENGRLEEEFKCKLSIERSDYEEVLFKLNKRNQKLEIENHRFQLRHQLDEEKLKDEKILSELILKRVESSR